ncbi:MAG: hypothetical protein JOZ05_22910, partial [Acetobacteraceae bacterium]|nr:hypothetical protein [Acetobacteraceae bacterium]
MRSLFLAGCLVLALPGLAACGFYAAQAWTAWRAAQAAALGAQAAGAVMRAAPLVMVERGRLQEAAFGADRDAGEAWVRAAAASDAALDRAGRALRAAGLSTAAVERVREGRTAIQSRAELVASKRSALRSAIEQYNRIVEGLEEEVSGIERGVTLANQSVGLAVGLARNAAELRSIAGRRGVLLNAWLGGQDLQPSQRDELLALNGRLAGAWERLQRGVRGSGFGSDLA